MSTMIVLITGANKGIGRGFVERYVERPSTTVVAAVRDPSSPEATELSNLLKGDGSSLILVTLRSDSETDAWQAIQHLRVHHGIKRLDLVIANAGIFKASAHQPISQLKIPDLMEHFEVNTNGVIRLFQATLALQLEAERPIFFVNSAGAATLAGMEDYAHFPLNSYSASKVAVNFVTRRIHFENPSLIAFAVHPGQVVTETRTAVARTLGASEQGMTVRESVDALMKLLDSATREATSGKFLNYDGTQLPW